MREVRGFNRPAVQWAFVVLAIVLSALAASLSLAVWRLNGTMRELRAGRLDDRAEREQLQGRLAREQATREALALELSRLRAGEPSASSGAAPPTLTLQPIDRREATPPDPTVKAPAPTQTIELRLVLPPHGDPTLASYEVTIREWVTGRVRLARGGLKTVPLARGHAVSAFVAGDIFVPGAYEVTLRNGSSEIASYEVAVE